MLPDRRRAREEDPATKSVTVTGSVLQVGTAALFIDGFGPRVVGSALEELRLRWMPKRSSLSATSSRVETEGQNVIPASSGLVAMTTFVTKRRGFSISLGGTILSRGFPLG